MRMAKTPLADRSGSARDADVVEVLADAAEDLRQRRRVGNLVVERLALVVARGAILENLLRRRIVLLEQDHVETDALCLHLVADRADVRVELALRGSSVRRSQPPVGKVAVARVVG